VLFLEPNDDGTVGGSHQVLLDLARHLDRRRCEPVAVFRQDNVLIPPLGAYGAVAATLISFAGRTALLHYFGNKVWPLKYDWSRQFRILVIAVPACAIDWIVPVEGFIGESSLAATLHTLYAAYIWRADLSEDLRTRARSGVNRLASSARRRVVPA
jgi:hypothetical protein